MSQGAITSTISGRRKRGEDDAATPGEDDEE
jgi:hypothetical protein